MTKATRFEKKVADGFKAGKMYAPVETITARQYQIRKNRENEKRVQLMEKRQ
jgi:hypothetical protein